MNQRGGYRGCNQFITIAQEQYLQYVLYVRKLSTYVPNVHLRKKLTVDFELNVEWVITPYRIYQL